VTIGNSIQNYDYLRFRIAEGIDFILFSAGVRMFEPEKEIIVDRGIMGVVSGRGQISYDIIAMERGLQKVWLNETVRYDWKLMPQKDIEGLAVLSSLDNRMKANWNLGPGGLEGDFRVVNYLGTAFIEILPFKARLVFEIISSKLDYESEYRSMVEGIANECQQLLLEWDSPTSLRFISDPDKISRILLEKFLFLRHALKPEKLELLLEIITRRPDSHLFAQKNWEPFSLGFDIDFLRNPLRFGRDWQKGGSEKSLNVNEYLPGELLVAKRFETYDTPPNRFVKFALEEFREICSSVIKKFSQETDRGTAFLEASAMSRVLDGFLNAFLFNEVKPLQQIPFNSQILQKREGYREILQAWILLETASRLDWPGREDAYDGTNRNAAILYEYWLYFVIFRLLKDKLELRYLVTNPNEEQKFKDFISIDKNGLTLNLKRGSQSRSVFVFGSGTRTVRIHFYYNRSFFKSEEVLSSGSYSRTFRPDYSLVLLPQTFFEKYGDNCELEAEKVGRIAFLHFDAKYRVETISELFGSEDGDLIEEKREMVVDVYKRGDLYKMHTYNEAIRRSVGSYVLYPGTDKQTTLFPRYHEILPGVGAFAIKPIVSHEGESTAFGLEALADFMKEVLLHQQDKLTQHYRLNYWTHDTIKQKPRSYDSTAAPPETDLPSHDATALLAFIRNQELLAHLRQKSMFYFHAIEENGSPAEFDPKVFRANFLIPYLRYQSEDWYAQILSTRLVSRADLLKTLQLDQNLLQSQSSYYYVVNLGEEIAMPRINLDAIVRPLGQRRQPIVKRWSDLFTNLMK